MLDGLRAGHGTGSRGRIRYLVPLAPGEVITRLRGLPEVGQGGGFVLEWSGRGFILRPRPETQAAPELGGLELRARFRYAARGTEVRARIVPRPRFGGTGHGARHLMTTLRAILASDMASAKRSLARWREDRRRMLLWSQERRSLANLMSRALSPISRAIRDTGPYRVG